jgi:hypothetical protein
MMTRNILLCGAFVFLFHSASTAQTADSTLTADSTAKISLSYYVDAYYAYYTDSMAVNQFQEFPSVSPRSNQFGLNTAMVTAQYDAGKVRALVTLHYGDIPVSAWSSIYNPVMEAHAGVRICKKLWLDAGFFRTHVGTEGLLPKENFASSVSVNTFYEPYFESGIRFNYIPSEKLSLNLLVLNGYNRYEENNDKKSFGLLINYTFNNNANIGYSNYTGDDSPQGDMVSHLMIHNSLFFNYQVKKIKMQAGGDYCVQQHADLTDANKSASMYSGVLSLKYLCCKKTSVYARGEFFNDEDGFMSGVRFDYTGKATGLIISGVTLGVEYKPTVNSYVRLEGRQLQAEKNQYIFYYDRYYRSYRTEVMLNMGVSF